MSAHSNKKLVQHIESSAQLLDKMHTTTQKLQTRLFEAFKTNCGVDLPNVILARVRQIDITMCYANDAKVDDYIDGARTLLKAGLGKDKLQIADSALDFVSVLAHRIIGSAGITVGVHSTSGYVGDYVTACLSVVEQGKATDWATESNFFVAAFALVLWKPTTTMITLAAPMVGGIVGGLGVGAAAGATVGAATISHAEMSYKFEPL
jgi:hypothetical protein